MSGSFVPDGCVRLIDWLDERIRAVGLYPPAPTEQDVIKRLHSGVYSSWLPEIDWPNFDPDKPIMEYLTPEARRVAERDMTATRDDRWLSVAAIKKELADKSTLSVAEINELLKSAVTGGHVAIRFRDGAAAKECRWAEIKDLRYDDSALRRQRQDAANALPRYSPFDRQRGDAPRQAAPRAALPAGYDAFLKDIEARLNLRKVMDFSERQRPGQREIFPQPPDEAPILKQMRAWENSIGGMVYQCWEMADRDLAAERARKVGELRRAEAAPLRQDLYRGKPACFVLQDDGSPQLVPPTLWGADADFAAMVATGKHDGRDILVQVSASQPTASESPAVKEPEPEPEPERSKGGRPSEWDYDRCEHQIVAELVSSGWKPPGDDDAALDYIVEKMMRWFVDHADHSGSVPKKERLRPPAKKILGSLRREYERAPTKRSKGDNA